MSRMRSPMISRSNWAKESRMLSVSRPMRGGGVERLGDRDEGDSCRSNTSTSRAKSISERRAGRSCRPPRRRPAPPRCRRAAASGPGAPGCRRRSRRRRSGRGTSSPALGPLAGDVGLAGLALGVEAVELLLQPLLGATCGCRRRSGACGRSASSCGARVSSAQRAQRGFAIVRDGSGAVLTPAADTGAAPPSSSNSLTAGSAPARPPGRPAPQRPGPARGTLL